MTPEQLPTLRAFILADVVLAGLIAQGAVGAVATALNAPTNPAFIVWRTSVSQDEIMQNGFDWTRVDNLSIGPARVWEWLFANESKSINPSKANVRAGIEAVWKGTAPDLAVRAAVYAHCKRAASAVEKLFATGTGTTQDPATMTHEGDISFGEVIKALEAV